MLFRSRPPFSNLLYTFSNIFYLFSHFFAFFRSFSCFSSFNCFLESYNVFRRVFYYCRPPFTHCQSLQRLTAHFEHSHPSTTSTPHNFAFSTFTTCFYVFLITVDCWRVLLHTRTLLRPPPAISTTRHSFPLMSS